MSYLETDAEFVEKAYLEELEDKIKTLRDEVHANLLSNNYHNEDLLKRIKLFRMCYFSKKYNLTPEEAFDYLKILTKERQNKIKDLLEVLEKDGMI